MKIPFLKTLMAIVILIATATFARASHVYGGRLTYTWISDSTYKITLTLYTNCGPESSGANSYLNAISPALCIMDSNNVVDTKPLQFDSTVSGTELFNSCTPPLVSQCQDLNSPVPGVRRYLYSLVYTLPHRTGNWHFVHSGSIYGGFGSNIAYIASLTSPSSTGSLLIYYEAKLKTSQNSSPTVTGSEQPYYCTNNPGTYSISATDPDGDSLYFALNPALGIDSYYGGADLCSHNFVTGTYLSPYTPTRPVVSSIFSYNHSTGEMEFVPSLQQRAMIAYTIYEYRAGVLVGTTQHNMTLTVLNCSDICTAGISDPAPDEITLYPNPAHDEVTLTCTGTSYNRQLLQT